MTFEHSELEFEPVKFCPSCNSDNIMTLDVDDTWLTCWECRREFQPYEADSKVQTDITMWRRKLEEAYA